jgi:hypothetical protein
MGDDKLRNCLRELEGQYGDAYQRVQSKGGLLFEHVQEARREAKSRGWSVEGETGSSAEPVSAAAVGVLTEPMECSECGRTERHYEDDYICRICRDAMSAPVAEDPEPIDPRIEPDPEPEPTVGCERYGHHRNPTTGLCNRCGVEVPSASTADLSDRLKAKLEAFNE